MEIDLKIKLIYENLKALSSTLTNTIDAVSKQPGHNNILDTLHLVDNDIKRHEASIKKILKVNLDEFEVVSFLNKALALEYNSIFDYHIFADAIDDDLLKKKLLHFGLMEMEHAKLLSLKITSLGGIPQFTSSELRKSRTLTIEEMFNEHKNGEIQAIALFEEGLKIISDPELNWFVGRLKLDEADHLKEIENLLSEYSDLKKIISISGKIKWHDDYVEDSDDRPWIE